MLDKMLYVRIRGQKDFLCNNLVHISVCAIAFNKRENQFVRISNRISIRLSQACERGLWLKKLQIEFIAYELPVKMDRQETVLWVFYVTTISWKRKREKGVCNSVLNVLCNNHFMKKKKGKREYGNGLDLKIFHFLVHEIEVDKHRKNFWNWHMLGYYLFLRIGQG